MEVRQSSLDEGTAKGSIPWISWGSSEAVLGVSWVCGLFFGYPLKDLKGPRGPFKGPRSPLKDPGIL